MPFICKEAPPQSRLTIQHVAPTGWCQTLPPQGLDNQRGWQWQTLQCKTKSSITAGTMQAVISHGYKSMGSDVQLVKWPSTGKTTSPTDPSRQVPMIRKRQARRIAVSIWKSGFGRNQIGRARNVWTVLFIRKVTWVIKALLRFQVIRFSKG